MSMHLLPCVLEGAGGNNNDDDDGALINELFIISNYTKVMLKSSNRCNYLLYTPFLKT